MHALRERRGGPPASARDDYQQLLGFSSSLYGEDSKSLVNLKLSMLPAEFSAHLNEKVPFEKCESLHQWIFQLKKEVDTVLMPMVRDRAPKSNAHFELAAQFLTGDRLIEDLDVEERLNASTDRALKRFYNLKMAHQLHPPKQPNLLSNKLPMQLESPDVIIRKYDE